LLVRVVKVPSEEAAPVKVEGFPTGLVEASALFVVEAYVGQAQPGGAAAGAVRRRVSQAHSPSYLGGIQAYVAPFGSGPAHLAEAEPSALSPSFYLACGGKGYNDKPEKYRGLGIGERRQVPQGAKWLFGGAAHLKMQMRAKRITAITGPAEGVSCAYRPFVRVQVLLHFKPALGSLQGMNKGFSLRSEVRKVPVYRNQALGMAHIEYLSKAGVAYPQAIDVSVSCG